MTPFLSFIVFLLTLVTFITGLINAFRKYKNPQVRFRWIFIPLFLSVVTLIINLNMERDDWNIKNLIVELNPQTQDSLEIGNNNSGDTIKHGESRKKIIKKSGSDKREFQSGRDTLIIAKQESENTVKIIGQRTITSEQKNKFVNFLRSEPKGNFRIIYIAGDAEAYEYSKLISNMLTEAGYNLSGGISDFAGNEAVEGISIVINRNETEPRFAQSIFYAFREIGINIVAERNKKIVKPLEVVISIGHKK